jgi:hypothetical protein
MFKFNVSATPGSGDALPRVRGQSADRREKHRCRDHLDRNDVTAGEFAVNDRVSGRCLSRDTMRRLQTVDGRTESCNSVEQKLAARRPAAVGAMQPVRRPVHAL